MSTGAMSRDVPVALVGVDWGTTHVRAFALDGEGAILDRRAGDQGAARLEPGGFAPALQALTGDWRAHGAPVLVCGMVGARRGWIEVAYRDCPAGIADLAGGLAWAAPGVHVTPGVCVRRDGRLVDVMRGEETQIMGALEPGEDAIVVCPGTHGKWAQVEGGRIVDFRTFMTGELFAVLRAHSLLGRGMEDGPFDPAAFEAGAARGLEDPAVTAALFSVRVGMLDGRLAPAATGDYLSGLLIGAEIAGAGAWRGGPIRLIGAPALAARYQRALALAGSGPVEIVDAEAAAARGLWRIWNEARP